MAGDKSDQSAKDEIKKGMAQAGKAAAQDHPQETDEPLRRSVQEAVPDAEQLPGSADDNPISQRVRDAAKGQKPDAGRSTLQGGDKVERQD